ncbi:MAG: NUDIX hydrolase [Thermoprotei archaeon]
MSGRPLVAVGCLVSEGNKVLLVRRKKPPNAGLLAVPGGKVEFGETLEKAVTREMKEETNLDVEVVDVLAIVQVIKEGFHYVIVDFLCRKVGGVERASSDASELVWVDLNELEEIRSSMSPSTYEMLERWKKGDRLPLIVTSRD